MQPPGRKHIPGIVACILVCAACSSGGGTAKLDGGEEGREDRPGDGRSEGVDPSCTPRPEECNGRDDDCDGVADNGFDLAGDPANCGACGWACATANARAVCREGGCFVDRCDEGFFDVNGDPWDGCEYACVPFQTNESPDDGSCDDGIDDDCDGRVDGEDGDCADCVPEFCDGADNDCDGAVDEDFDLRTDPAHCGGCGTVCPARPRARGACVMGECALVCEEGWSDLDRDVANGCEAECVPRPDANEAVCNGTDEDCDGTTDEDYVPYVCGVGACITPSVCARGAETCVPVDPKVDADTTCDGRDDDCDGSVDEDFVPSGVCTGSCRETARCAGGREECGEPAAQDATCNGKDDDCDGVVDDEYRPTTCGTGGCTRQSTCLGGVEDCDSGPPSAEVCNGSDDDCNGTIDNGDISALCPEVPSHGRVACRAGSCVISGCDPGWFDVDGTYLTGCECQTETSEPASTSCTGAFNIGTISDSGAGSLTASGNIVPAGDSDWYKFTASDSPDTSCDKFHVKVSFSVNPSNAFRMDVYSGSCLDVDPCLGEKDLFEMRTNNRTGSGTSARGECPCMTGASISPGNNECTDNTTTFFVRVYRAAGVAVSCAGYTLAVTNGR